MAIPLDRVKISDASTRSKARGILNIPFDPEFTPGARNAIRVCLRVQPPEKVCVITDEVTLEIAAAIVHELEVSLDADALD